MKGERMEIVKRGHHRTACLRTVVGCWLTFASCGKSAEGTSRDASDDLKLYRATNNQPGHEFVKTEQFLVPAGSVIVIKGLEFQPGKSTLTPTQKEIVQQVFNSIEEITENTLGDSNTVRVAEFKKMEFEIRGYPDNSAGGEADVALSEARAKAVLEFLTYLGTPPWRLKAKGLVMPHHTKEHIEFVRVK
jgi:outer membrane protein OmpA-like peptidoglycan-associated protein